MKINRIEALKILGIPMEEFWQMRRDGKITPVDYLNGEPLFEKEDVEALKGLI